MTTELQTVAVIQSNAKTPGGFTESIAKCTAWIGANSTKKTAKQEAISLAVENRRIVGEENDKLSPKDEPLHSKLSLAIGGRSMTYAYSAEGTVDATQPAINIVRPATWLTRLGPALASERVAARWGGESATNLLLPPDTLTAAQKDLWVTGVKEVLDDIRDAREKLKKRGGDISDIASDPATLLGELQSWGRRAKLAKSKERSGLEKALEQTRQALGSLSGVEDLPRLEQLAKTADAYERAAPARARAQRYNQEIQNLQNAIAQYNTLQRPQDRAPWAAHFTACQAAYNAARDIIVSKQGLMTAAGASPNTCPCCLAAYDQQVVIIRLHGEIQASPETLKPYEDAVNAAQQALAELEKYEQAYAAERNKIAMESQRLEIMNRELTIALQGAPESYSGPTSFDLAMQLSNARKAAEAKKLLEGQTEGIARAQSDWDMYQTIEQAAGIRLNTFIKQISDSMNAAIRAALPAHLRDRYRFDTKKYKFEMVGHDGRGQAWREQGRGEDAALNLAVALAWADGPFILELEFERDLAAMDVPTRKSVLDAIADLARTAHNLVFVTLTSPEPLPLDDRWLIHWTDQQTEYTAAAGEIPIVRNAVPAIVQGFPALVQLPQSAPSAFVTVPEQLQLPTTALLEDGDDEEWNPPSMADVVPLQAAPPGALPAAGALLGVPSMHVAPGATEPNAWSAKLDAVLNSAESPPTNPSGKKSRARRK